MQNKFEQLLDYLVNEETDKANELFHEIIVEKSRTIYENLISEEEKEEKDKREEEEEESAKTEENFGMGGEQVIEIGGDETDDLMHDVGMGDDEGDEFGGEEDEFGGEHEGDHDEEQDHKIEDLEDALAELKAEFEKLMAGEEGEEHMGDEEGEEEGEEEDEGMMMREYTENVGKAYGGGKVASSHESGADNKKSVVAGKNDMGGTAKNLNQGGEVDTKGTKGGLLNPATKDLSSGNVNVPGGTNAKQFFKKDSSGHGAEKKGSGEDGGINKKSPLAPGHNK